VIRALTAPGLAAELCAVAAFVKRDLRSRKLEPRDPSESLTGAVLSRGEWPELRELTGVASHPILHEDGSLWSEKGWDPVSGLFCAPRCGVTIPEPCDWAAAKAAYSALCDPVSDFPWVSDLDRDAWVAALLSPLARPLCGLSPAFMVTSTVAASGKGKLVNVISLIVQGCDVATSIATEEDELRKRILAHLLAGDQIVCLDNVPLGSSVGWAVLDSLLTTNTITDRILGESLSPRVRNRSTWFITGNNLSVRGDTGRRIVLIRLAPDTAHPELRTDYREKDLMGHVRARRSELLSAALTILAAFLRAKPSMVDQPTLGSFEPWVSLVRNALVWIGASDVLRAVANRTPDADPDLLVELAFLEAWLAQFPAESYPNGVTARRATDSANISTRSDFANALRDLAHRKDGQLPTAGHLGFRLRAISGRIYESSAGRIKLAKAGEDRDHSALWQVQLCG
jgi:hypothetical protein